MGFRRRLLLLYLTACLGALVVWLRVGQLQVLEAEEWARAARRGREQTVELEPRRGAILDADGLLLVEDAPVLQLALVPSEWAQRRRLRCDACGAVLFTSATARRPSRCRCKASEEHLIPLGEGDLAPLEDLLGLAHGTLADRAADRADEIEGLVEDYRARLAEEGDDDDFLVEDRVRLFREAKESLPIPLVGEVKEAAARFVALDELGVTRGLVLRPSHRRVAAASGALARTLGQSTPPSSPAELRRLQARWPDDDIDGRTLVGRAGLELAYDAVLRGRSGWERRCRDEQGAFTEVVETDPPHPGGRVRLAASLDACALAQRCLEGLPDLAAHYAPRNRPSGALVLMDASNGEILALAELPAWSPADEDDGLDLERRTPALPDLALGDWVPARRVRGPLLGPEARRSALERLEGFERLLLPWRLQPPVLEPWTDPPESFDRAAWRRLLCRPTGALLSRVSQVAVEPGSTFKVFIGLGMLESGLPLPIPGEFTCAGSLVRPACHAHGAVDFEGALCVSCNRYFAMSLRNFRSHWPTYRDQVGAFIDRLGFGHRTGGDLKGEARGRWLSAAEAGPGAAPRIDADDGQNVAIGQGPALVTPLQMVRAVAVLANGGRLVTPHLARRVEEPDGSVHPPAFPVEDLHLTAAHVARVREGMRRAVYDAGGTAYRSFEWGTLPGRVYGKTGTAQVGREWKPFEPDSVADVTHQWFVGFLERDGQAPLAFAVVHHARQEKAAGLTAARTAGALLSAWCAR